MEQSFESGLSGFKIWTEMEDFSSRFEENDPDVDVDVDEDEDEDEDEI